MSILIAAGTGVGRCFGSQPRAKVSMMIMRPPQHGHGCGSTRGSSIAALGVSGSFGRDGTASSLRACAMFAARLAGEQAIVADAMEALRQHVDQEAADELVGRQRHRLVSGGPFDPIILPLEGDALVVGRDQAAIGDGDAVGVARQIAQHLPGPAERLLGIDHPVDLAQRRQIGLEGSLVGERACSPKNCRWPAP